VVRFRSSPVGVTGKGCVGFRAPYFVVREEFGSD